MGKKLIRKEKFCRSANVSENVLAKERVFDRSEVLCVSTLYVFLAILWSYLFNKSLILLVMQCGLSISESVSANKLQLT